MPCIKEIMMIIKMMMMMMMMMMIIIIIIDNKHCYDHVLKSVTTSHEGKVTI